MGAGRRARILGADRLAAAPRTTVYTLTNRRVVMRIGVGAAVTLNLPFALHRSRRTSRVSRDGTGTIALDLTERHQLAYLVLLAACPALADRRHRSRRCAASPTPSGSPRCWPTPREAAPASARGRAAARARGPPRMAAE